MSKLLIIFVLFEYNIYVYKTENRR